MAHLLHAVMQRQEKTFFLTVFEDMMISTQVTINLYRHFGLKTEQTLNHLTVDSALF